MRRNIIAIALMLSACSLFAGRSYVAKSGTGSGAFLGARTTIYSAVQYAAVGDTVFVAAGTWVPTTGTDRIYSHTLRDGITIMGGFAGTEDSITAQTIAGRDLDSNATILSGEIGTSSQWDNCYHVVYANFAATNGGAVLDGFTITRGYANGSLNHSYGPGILIRGADGGVTTVTLKNILFTENSSGGAVTCWPSASARAIDLTMENCRFTANSTALSLNAETGPVDARIVGCSFANSVAVRAGIDALTPGTVNADFYNCTFTSTFAVDFRYGTINTDVYNSVLSSNSNTYTAYTSFKNCLVRESGGSGAWAIASADSGGNIDTDPFMTSLGNGIYELTSKSPCINAADSTGLTSLLPATDVIGNPRIFADTLDLGAFEFQGPFLPYFTNTPATIDTTAMQDQQWTMTLSATDRDDDSLRFSIASAPDSLTLDAEGILLWTPTRADYGTHDVMFYVSQDSVPSDSLAFTITVDVTNSAPNFISTTAIEDVPRLAFYNDNKTLKFRLLAEDPDGDSLRFRFQGYNYPSGMYIDSLTGVISFTPTAGHPSANPYIAEVYDPFGKKDVFSHTMYVRADNTPPKIYMSRITMDTVIQIGDDWTIDMNGSDADNQKALHNWHYYCADTLNGFTFDTLTGVATWSPTAADTGIYLVGFEFNDGGNVSDTFEVYLHVTMDASVHDRPVLLSGLPGRAFARSLSPVGSSGMLAIEYGTPVPAVVQVSLSSLDGQTVLGIGQRRHPAGSYTTHLPTAGLAAGRYLCSVIIGDQVLAVPVMILNGQ